jgi:scyllo-inositol 2-dehydrogenase (NADP+)
MNQPILTAIVALGRAGWSIHADHLRTRKDFQLVDVADPDPKRLEEAAGVFGCKTHTDLGSLLKSSKAQLVIVATPSFRHEEDAIEVLRSGRHCIIEKPMAMSFAGAQRMVEAAKKAKKKLFVHQNYRFAADYLHLREVIDSKILGEVFEIRTSWDGYARRNDWQTLRKNGGGVLNNTCPHTIDMLLNLLDAPVTSLLSDLQHIKDAGDCEDHVRLFMKAKNGRVADMSVSTVNALPGPKWQILGSHGTLSSDGTTSTLKYYDPQALPALEVIDGAVEGRKYGVGETIPWKEETRPVAPIGKYPGFYDNVAAVITKGQEMVISPESAAEIIRIIEWARVGTAFAGQQGSVGPKTKKPAPSVSKRRAVALA